MDCWRISRSHRLRGAGAFGATFSFGFEKKDVSFAISFSRLQPQQNAGPVSLRSRCVAALSLSVCRLYTGGHFWLNLRLPESCPAIKLAIKDLTIAMKTRSAKKAARPSI